MSDSTPAEKIQAIRAEVRALANPSPEQLSDLADRISAALGRPIVIDDKANIGVMLDSIIAVIDDYMDSKGIDVLSPDKANKLRLQATVLFKSSLYDAARQDNAPAEYMANLEKEMRDAIKEAGPLPMVGTPEWFDLAGYFQEVVASALSGVMGTTATIVATAVLIPGPGVRTRDAVNIELRGSPMVAKGLLADIESFMDEAKEDLKHNN